MTTPSVQSQVSEQEWQLRQDLAACYRLLAHYRMTDLIYTHCTVRIPGPEHHYLINPYGLMWDEITADDLVLIDAEVNRQAAMIAYLDDFWMLAILVGCFVPLVLLMQSPKPGGAAPPME